jgi:hypothetical protein
MNRFLAAGGLIVGLVIGAFAIAAVSAQEDTPTPTPSAEESTDTRRDAYKEKLAENLGIPVEDLEAAIKQTHLDLIDEALADGRIDEERAAELRDRVENGEPLFPHHGGPGGHHGPGGFPGIHWIAESAKEILGLEDGELRQAYADGKSLSDLAEENGISVDDFKSQLLAAAETKLTEKVSDGDITQEQADNILERLTNNIDDIINNTPPVPPADGEGLRFGGPQDGFAPAPFFEQEEAEIDA